MFVLLQDSCQKLQKEEEADRVYSVLDLFRTPRLRNTTLLLIAIWYVYSHVLAEAQTISCIQIYFPVYLLML